MVVKSDKDDLDSVQLSESEQKAKDFMFQLFTEAVSVECDSGELSDIKLELPAWYDREKFKRGQQYFKDNRFGILTSNLYGLLSMIAEPKGVKILASTGRSSTPETSKKRYIQTVFHTLSWYENELEEDSKSWKSLELVRKMHHMASKQAQKKGLGIISQIEVALTAYGFMGYALTRAHTMGIRYDNDEDREAFVFFWAVICSMLGVQDKYNMCLHSLDVVIAICEICRRYIFIQILQLETPTFNLLARAFFDGLQKFMPLMSYEAMMFLNKRTAGIPGYQYAVDLERETLCKPVFSVDEIKQIHQCYSKQEGYEYMRDFIVDGKIRLLNLRTRKNSNSNNNNYVEKFTSLESDEGLLSPLHRILELKYPEDLSVTVLEDSKWSSYLSDAAFQRLSSRDQMFVKLRCQAFQNNYKSVGYWINDKLTRWLLYQMEKENV